MPDRAVLVDYAVLLAIGFASLQMMLDGCRNTVAIAGIKQALKFTKAPRHLLAGCKHAIHRTGRLHTIGCNVPDGDDIAAIFSGDAESLL